MPDWSGGRTCWRAPTAASPRVPLRPASIPPSCGPSSRPWRRAPRWRPGDSGPVPAGDRSGSGCVPWSDPARGGTAVTFNEVLSQTIAMLQQHGRVSYRALKRQFTLDDAFLKDLKYELVAVQQRAVDQDGT